MENVYTLVAHGHVMRFKVRRVRMRNKFILPTSQLIAVNKEGWAFCAGANKKRILAIREARPLAGKRRIINSKSVSQIATSRCL